jgi:hypothetical protein
MIGKIPLGIWQRFALLVEHGGHILGICLRTCSISLRIREEPV